MTIERYGKRDLSQGLYQDIHQSSMHETTRLLEDTVRIADETEEIGQRTAKELGHQREMIDDTGRYLASMRNLARSAKTSIRQIHEKIRRKTICLWMVIIVLFLANIAVIVLLIHNRGRLFTYDD